MNLKDRIIQFITYKGIEKAVFERNCGLSNDAVSKMGENTRKSTLDKVSNVYPELNINWLKTGEGEMLKTSIDESAPTPIPSSPAPALSTESLLRIVESQQRTIENLSRIIGNMSGKE